LPATVPANLSLVFLPPYSPELNPIERLWLVSGVLTTRSEARRGAG
jgi:transposase